MEDKKINKLQQFDSNDQLAFFEEGVDMNMNMEEMIEILKDVDFSNIVNIKGDKGDEGEQGVEGIQGRQGTQGVQGEKGEQGDKGDKGDDGLDADEELILERLIESIPEHEELVLNPEDVREKLESIKKEDDKLDSSAIRDFDKKLNKLEKKIKKGGGTTIFGGAAQLLVTEEDNSPSYNTTVLRFANGTISTNDDGSVSIANGGGGGGSGDMTKAVYDTDDNGVVDNSENLEGNDSAYHLSRANHTGTQTASTISDFDTEVSNNTDVAANTAARHDAVTVTDSAEIDFTLTGQDITASLVASSIDETKLDASVNASLDLADSALQAETDTLDDVTGRGASTTNNIDLGGATNFEIPNNASPTLNTDGQVAVDTSITDMSHGLMKFYSGEEIVNIGMPVAQLSALIDNYVPTYNASTDEFEMQPVPSGSGDTITTTVNAVQKDSTGGTSDTYGVLAGLVNGSNALYTVSTGEYVSGTLTVYRNGKRMIQGSSEDWVETTPASGTFTFNTAPESGDVIDVEYSDQNVTASALIVEKDTQSVSANYTILSTDRNILVNAAAAARTITLPEVADIDSIGVSIIKIDSSGNDVIIATPNSETINGASTQTMNTPYQSRTIITDGTNYYIQ